MLGKTVPQPKGNFLMELRDLPFHGSGHGIEWFEVAILEGVYTSLVQPHTKKHWHLYRKSNIVSGGVRRRFYLTFEIKHSPYHPI